MPLMLRGELAKAYEMFQIDTLGFPSAMTSVPQIT